MGFFTGFRKFKNSLLSASFSDGKNLNIPGYSGWIDVPFNDADFTSNAGTWTVESGDVAEFQYLVIADTMIVNFRIDSTSVSGSPLDLKIAIPGGYKVDGDFSIGGHCSDGGSLESTRISARTLTGNVINIQKAFGATWSNATNTTTVRGQIIMKVSG